MQRGLIIMIKLLLFLIHFFNNEWNPILNVKHNFILSASSILIVTYVFFLEYFIDFYNIMIILESKFKF